MSNDSGRSGRRRVALPVLLCIALLAGCGPLKPRPLHAGGGGGGPCGGGEAVGVLNVTGGDVSLNGRPGRDGDAVCDGDQVSTGAGGGASIVIGDDRQSDFVQLNENTDPRFTWLKGSHCLWVHELRYGQVLADNSRRRTCMLVRTPDVDSLSTGGRVLYTARPARRGEAAKTEITVVHGRVSALAVPDPHRLQAMSPVQISRLSQVSYAPDIRVTYSARRIVQPQLRLPRQEVLEAVRWSDALKLEAAPALRAPVRPREPRPDPGQPDHGVDAGRTSAPAAPTAVDVHPAVTEPAKPAIVLPEATGAIDIRSSGTAGKREAERLREQELREQELRERELRKIELVPLVR